MHRGIARFPHPAELDLLGQRDLLLRFTHPDQFGVFSTPVLYMVQLGSIP